MKRICSNFNLFKKYFVQRTSIVFAVVSGALLFIDKECFGIDSIQKSIWALIIIFTIVTLWTILKVCFYKENVVFKTNQGKLSLRYADLWKIAFPVFSFFKKADKKIIVVGVNTSFDTIVDEDIAAVKNPLVSPKTIHGQWIKKMNECGVSAEELNRAIHENLEKQGIVPIKRLNRANKERGNLDCYEKGTIAVYRYDNIFFYLLALSEFDEKNNARNTKEELIKTIEKLIQYYDSNGQGYDIYVPLLGTGKSRTDISSEEALLIISSYFRIHKDKVQSDVNVIVYNKQRDSVSLDI